MAERRVTQNAAVNRDLYPVESSRHQTEAEDRERVLSAQFTDGLVLQNHWAIPQQDTVVLPVASGGRPADPQCPAITERRHGESRHPLRDWNKTRGGTVIKKSMYFWYTPRYVYILQSTEYCQVLKEGIRFVVLFTSCVLVFKHI